MNAGRVLFEEDIVEREAYSRDGVSSVTIGTRPVGGYCVRLLRFENVRTFFVLDARRYAPAGDASKLLDCETEADAIREAVAQADMYRGMG